MEKYQTYVTGRYKVFGEGLQVYGDMLWSKRKQDNGLAPAPFAFGTERISPTIRSHDATCFGFNHAESSAGSCVIAWSKAAFVSLLRLRLLSLYPRL